MRPVRLSMPRHYRKPNLSGQRSNFDSSLSTRTEESMGGRIASLIADVAGVDGLVCLGYPFHPVGKPDKLRVEHLGTIKTPTLIVQGERDSFGTRAEVAQYKLSPSIRVCWMP